MWERDEIKEIISELKNEIAGKLYDKASELNDDEFMEMLEDLVFQNNKIALLSNSDICHVLDKLFYSLRSDLGILQPLVDDKETSEIMINSIDEIFIEKNGEISRVDSGFDSVEELEEIIRRICGRVHRDVNELNPIVDARLYDGSRLNVVYKNIALNGHAVTIRKFPQKAIGVSELINYGTIDRSTADFLKTMVLSGHNIFISGGTSSGKTTFLNALTEFIPKSERLVVIEDSAELQIKGVDNLVRLECRNANVQGIGEIDMQRLIKTSLRMRPDRIIVGEVRGKEVIEMIQAMNTGHDGSLCTGHGNSIKGMILRLESMFLQGADFPINAIRAQISEAIDIFVHLAKLQDGSRKVVEIAELAGLRDGEIVINHLYEYDGKNGLFRTKNDLVNKNKLRLYGYECS